MPGKSLKPSKPCILGTKSQFLNIHLVSISSVSKALAAKMLFATYDVTNTTHLLPARGGDKARSREWVQILLVVEMFKIPSGWPLPCRW